MVLDVVLMNLCEDKRHKQTPAGIKHWRIKETFSGGKKIGKPFSETEKLIECFHFIGGVDSPFVQFNLLKCDLKSTLKLHLSSAKKKKTF